jgi:hypothetical protein
MKLTKLTIKSLLVFAIALAPLTIVSGQGAGLPGSSWWTFFQVQNVSTSSGSLQIAAYTQDIPGPSNTFSSGQFTIPAGGGLSYNPGFAPSYSTGGNRIGFCTNVASCAATSDDTLPSGFSGAVVASADVNIVAVAQVGNYANGSVGNTSGKATGNYAGVSAPASQLLFPLAKYNFASNTVAYFVQAAGVDANVTITYTMNDGSKHTESATIVANHMHLFDPANVTGGGPVASTGCLGGAVTASNSPCLGSAVVVATSGQIAGVALEFPESPSGFAKVLGASRGFTPADYSNTILAPVFKNDFPNATNGNYSGWAIQNTADVTATVNITLTVARTFNSGVNVGQQYFSTVTIAPNAQTVVSKFRNNMGGMPAGLLASAIAVSDQPIVAVANEGNANNAGTPVLSTYNCFAPSSATTKVAAPLVKEFFPGGISSTNVLKSGTSVTVQNAGDSNTNVYLVYKLIAGAAAGQTYTVTIGANQGVGVNGQQLAPGAAYVFNMVTDPNRTFNNLPLYTFGPGSTSLPPSTGFNATVSVTADQPIIAVMQEDNKTSSPNDLTNYEGFNQ